MLSILCYQCLRYSAQRTRTHAHTHAGLQLVSRDNVIILPVVYGRFDEFCSESGSRLSQRFKYTNLVLCNSLKSRSHLWRKTRVQPVSTWIRHTHTSHPKTRVNHRVNKNISQTSNIGWFRDHCLHIRAINSEFGWLAQTHPDPTTSCLTTTDTTSRQIKTQTPHQSSTEHQQLD